MQENYASSLKDILGGGGIILLGTLVSKIAGFLRHFVVIKFLSPNQYGLFALGLAFISTISELGNLGYNIGAQRFIAFHEARNEFPEVNGTIRSALRAVLVSAVSIFIILFFLSDRISRFLDKPDFKIPLMILSVIIPAVMLIMILTSFFYGFRRPYLAEIIKDFSFSIFSVIFILIGLLIKRKLIFAILGLSLSYFLTLILGLTIFKRKIWARFNKYKPASLGRRLFIFSFPLFFASLGSVILGQTDTLMLGYFTTSETLGFYNSAFILSLFVALFLNSLGTMFMPVLTRLAASGKVKDAKNLYQVVTRWLFILTLPLFLTFFLFPSRVLSLVFSSHYAQAGLCLAILSISEFLNTFLGPNYQALTAFGEIKILFVSWSTAAVSNIIMNYFFIKRWGINGAAAATGISLVILNLINSTVLYIRHGLHPFGRKYILPVLTCTGASALLYLPLRALVERSSWFVLICYPLFLLLGIGFTLLTRSVSEEDVLVYRALKTRVKALLKR